MPGRKALLLSCLSALVLLSTLREGTRASVGGRQAAEAREVPGVQQKIFMQESDASSFLQRRGRRSPKLHGEVNAENRQKLRADELRREYYEEQRNKFENLAEEQKDEGLCCSLITRVLTLGPCSKHPSSEPFSKPPAAACSQDPTVAILPDGANSSENEQEERSWEAVEQWRQWHYDGLFPSYLYDRHHI
ncbi:Putative cartilage matrix-associated protein [Fukomys damarensis]|uniref:Unique cartilage matrix-associated protein n=1 Tax=Fukomys damarensis TaxID=885580 RepID=A0A091DW57_FUKDA|nr:Putative cartilage matrix-associated protein [Fukomys damarensis]